MGIDHWLSFHWFRPDILKSFEWEHIYWFYALLIIPGYLIARVIITYLLKENLAIAMTKTNLKSDLSSLLRFIPFILLACSVVCVIIALARPQSTNEQVEKWSEGIDIILSIDISESMKLEDLKPNRLEAAKDVASKFVSGRFQDRIGLVVFSGEAFSRSPLTTDYELLQNYIGKINFSLIEKGGTAIGSALGAGTNRLRESDSKSKVLILLSDGDNTAGNLDPVTAAKLAAAYNIKVYTIAIGREGRVPYGKDFFGQPRYVENNLDESTLREIAKIGKGRFYRVSDKKALEAVFQEIDKLEKAEIKESRYKDTTDYYRIYLYWAIFFFLCWLLTKSTFLTGSMMD